ncbi:MAG: hypothetical protein P9L90_04735 [Candidatus Aadella gelida]|nr:hypothetical protein [Candidatus Aadella gelida]
MKTIICTVMLIALCVSVGYTADLSATGHDWMGYTQEEKVEFVNAAYKELGVGNNAFPAEKIAENMDMMYKFKSGKGLDTLCVDMVGSMTGK